MSGTVIVGSGGGHAAVKAIAHHFPHLSADDQAAAVLIFQSLIAFSNEKCGTDLDPNNP